MSLILSRAILKTLIYADLFDYPLTEEEIWKRIIKIKNIIKNLSRVKSRNLKIIKYKNGFYYLRGREEIVALRQKREKWSEEKLKIAKKIAAFLQFIPTIKLIGITGALAIDNVKEDDDIDLFIVTSQGLLWTTRLLATFLIEVTGRRRHPDETIINDKICLNMLVDEKHLAVPPSERDLFSAYEVIQMKLLYEKDDTYQKFLQANLWVKDYLPNAIGIKNALKTPRGWQAESHDSPEVEGLVKRLFDFLERFLKSFQLWYMRKRRTSEVIKDGIIRFHPQDARKWVLKKYNQRLINLGL